MNTGLGLNFLRIVNEKGSNGWSQIYARVPFDDVELKIKGALFGAVIGGDTDSWADLEVEMTTWIDEYFNGHDAAGELNEFYVEWKNKYKNLSGVWLWIKLVEENRREIKIVKSGDVGIYLKRNGDIVDLMGRVEEGRVIKGIVNEGETLYMWTGVLGEKILSRKEVVDEEERVFDLGKELSALDIAASGLIFKIDKLTKNDENEAVSIDLQAEIIPVQKEHEIKKTAETAHQYIDPSVEIIRNRYVGPIGVKEKISNWWEELRTKKASSTRVGENVPKRKRLAVIFGILFLFLLLVSLISGSIKMKGEADDKKWRSFYEPIEKSRQEALSLAQLNPVGAKKMMEEVKTTYEIKKAEFLVGKHKNEVVDLGKKIDEGWVVTSGEKSVEIEDVAKIDLVRSGFVGDRIAVANNEKMLVIDNSLGVLVSVGMSSKDIRVVAGKKEGEKWIDVTGEDSNALIMNNLGVKGTKSDKELIVFDSAVAGPISVGKFMENIYVLDQANKEIYKYAASGDGFGTRTRWLKLGVTLGTLPIDMAIDVDIWIARESGEVEKYRRGSKEQFSLVGVPSGIKIARMAVEIDGGRIALLDSNMGIVMICNKENGNCSQQLKSERLKTARDLEFGSDGGLYVLFPGAVSKLKQ